MGDNSETDSSDTNTVERRSPLYDLPLHVLEQVKGELPLADCLALRKVSRDLRRLVDSQIHCDVIEFSFGCESATMKLDDLELTYHETVGGGCMVNSNRRGTLRTKTHRYDRSFAKALIADAATFLANPKLEIGHIEFRGFKTHWWMEFMKFLESLNLRLNVKSIRSKDLELLHSIQEFLNPEKLEAIISMSVDNVPQFNRIARTNMEILRNMKLKFDEFTFSSFSGEAVAQFSEILKSINSPLNIRTVLVFDGKWIPTILQYWKPENVEDVVIENLTKHHLPPEDLLKLTVDQFNAIAGKKQWKTKTSLYWCPIPEGIGLEKLVDFKEIRCEGFEFTVENLVIIRDIYLKSPQLKLCKLKLSVGRENVQRKMNEMNTRFERIMGEDSAYHASTRRFLIPNSRDYFQLELEEEWSCIGLIIRRILTK